MRKLLIMLAALGSLAAAQGIRYDHQVTSTIGAAGSLVQVIAIPNALTYVCSGTYTGTACAAAGVTVYSDAALTVPIPQPLVSDAQGNITSAPAANGGFYYDCSAGAIYYTTTPPQGSPAGSGSTTISLPGCGGGSGAFSTLTATSPEINGTGHHDIEQMLFPDLFAGADAGAKSNALIAALPDAGGFLWATGQPGAQAAAETITNGAKSIEWQMPAGVYSLTAQVDTSQAGNSSAAPLFGGARIEGCGIGCSTFRNAAAGALDGSPTGVLKFSDTGAGTQWLSNFTVDRATEPDAEIAGDNGIVSGATIQNPVTIEGVEVARLGGVGIYGGGATASTMILDPYIHRLAYNYAIRCDDSRSGGSACQNFNIIGASLFNNAGGVDFTASTIGGAAGDSLGLSDIEGDDDPNIVSSRPAVNIENANSIHIWGNTLTKLTAPTPAATIYINDSSSVQMQTNLINCQVGDTDCIQVTGTSDHSTISDSTLNGNPLGAGKCINLNGAGVTNSVVINANCKGFSSGNARVFHSSQNGTFILDAFDNVSGLAGLNYYGDDFFQVTTGDGTHHSFVVADSNSSPANVIWYDGSTQVLSLGGAGDTQLRSPTTTANILNATTLEQDGDGVATALQLPGSGSITTTAAASDTVPIAWPDGGTRTPGHCTVGATNASAATNITDTYISAKADNQVTLTHAATAGMSYDVVCTVN